MLIAQRQAVLFRRRKQIWNTKFTMFLLFEYDVEIMLIGVAVMFRISKGLIQIIISRFDISFQCLN